MDHIIVFSDKEQVSRLDRIKFSYKRPYQLHITMTISQLQTVIQKHKEALLIYITDVLSNKDRIILQNIRQNREQMATVLGSHKKYALDAWQLDLFHFIPLPITNQNLVNVYRKYIGRHGTGTSAVHLKTKEGLITIDARHICYIKASGNYSLICVRDGKSYLPTRQLQHYEYLCEENQQMLRIHRSLIINIAKIQKVDETMLYFYGETKALTISKSLAIKIKRHLLGK